MYCLTCYVSGEEFLSRKGCGRKAELEEVQVQPIDNAQSKELHNAPQAVVDHTTPLIAHELHKSFRIYHEPRRYGFLMTSVEVLLIENDKPTTYEETIANKDSTKWVKAMQAKIDPMYNNQVWTLVDLPKGTIPIGCK